MLASLACGMWESTFLWPLSSNSESESRSCSLDPSDPKELSEAEEFKSFLKWSMSVLPMLRHHNFNRSYENKTGLCKPGVMETYHILPLSCQTLVYSALLGFHPPHHQQSSQPCRLPYYPTPRRRSWGDWKCSLVCALRLNNMLIMREELDSNEFIVWVMTLD